MNGNENFKSVQNTVVTQTTVNPVLNDNLVVEEYGIFSPHQDVYTYPVVFNNNAKTISLDELLRAKTNAALLGLAVCPQNQTGTTLSVLTGAGMLTLPVSDTPAGATTLLNLLGLNSVGKQCLLKFSVYGVYNSLDVSAPNNDGTGFPPYGVYLRNSSGTGFNVVFAENNDGYGAQGLLFGKRASGPYSYVVATNKSTTSVSGVVNPVIEFRTIVYSVCCSYEPGNEPGYDEPFEW